MSDSDGNFRTQVASVLDALVKVATTELTKLFESRYVTLATVVLGEKQNKLQNECLETPKANLQNPARIFRSIGVQVDERTTNASTLQTVEQDSEGAGDCSNECIEEAFTKDILPVEANKSADHEKPVLKEKAEMKLRKFCALESSNASDPVTDDVQIEGPIPESNHVEKPQDTEASAFSTIAPCGVSLWSRLSAVREMENCRQLKLSSADHKLLRPCSVQLVNMLLLPGSGERTGGAVASRDVANNKIRISKPKDLRPHQGVHTGRRLCCFTQCGSGVWRLQEVVSHNNAGYTCKICGKRYKHRKILRRHERFHTGEKPYSCSRCSKTFALRKSLRRHERFHTGERPHTCSECGKCFHLRDNLKAHLRFHNGERPFTCSICAKSFRICRNLEKHKRSHCVSGLSSFKLIAGL